MKDGDKEEKGKRGKKGKWRTRLSPFSAYCPFLALGVNFIYCKRILFERKVSSKLIQYGPKVVYKGGTREQKIL